MDLYKDIIINMLENEIITIEVPSELIYDRCYNALEKIKSILENDGLTYSECFNKIEEIICVFEDLGSSCGNRHNLG